MRHQNVENFRGKATTENARDYTERSDDETLNLGASFAPTYFFEGLAAVDPVGASESVASLPETSADQRRKKVRAWRELIGTLNHRGDERWNWLKNGQFQLWVPDQVDF